MLLVRLTSLISTAPENIIISEENNVYDLTDISDFEKTIIKLNPSNTYYPNVYLTPQNIDTIKPVSTEFYDQIKAEYLSQKFILKFPDTSDVYKLTFKLSGRHAMRVYINGNKASQTGKLGLTKKDTTVWENNITCYACPENGQMEIILNSAEFYHFKRGACLANLSLTKTYSGIDTQFSSHIKGFTIIGVLICITLFLICMFALNPSSKQTLYFAFACLSMMLRECLQSQSWTYFNISGNISFMLEYMSVVLITIFLSLYLGKYTKNKYLHSIMYAAIIGSFIYGMLLLITDSVFYTSILKYYQIILVLCIITGISGLFWELRHPLKEQMPALYGIAVFYLAAVSDILMYSNIFGETHPNRPISELAMLVFAITQAVSLFMKNNRLISQAKAREQKLAMENEALESVNKMKTEFLGNVSHELKTPLTVVSGYAQTVSHEVKNSKELSKQSIVNKMKLISSEAKRLSVMVNQVLDVTRIEEGKMVMEKVPCHLDEIVHQTVDTHYPMLNKNENQLYIKIDNTISDIVADKTRISQVIINLISNAVRFTVKGKITITAKEEGDFIVVSICDTGAGISKEKLPFIFDRYNSKEKTDNDKNTGTGLGLYICKHIIEEHGGQIWAESEQGKGTCVSFTLPKSQS